MPVRGILCVHSVMFKLDCLFIRDDRCCTFEWAPLDSLLVGNTSQIEHDIARGPYYDKGKNIPSVQSLHPTYRCPSRDFPSMQDNVPFRRWFYACQKYTWPPLRQSCPWYQVILAIHILGRTLVSSGEMCVTIRWRGSWICLLQSIRDGVETRLFRCLENILQHFLWPGF